MILPRGFVALGLLLVVLPVSAQEPTQAEVVVSTDAPRLHDGIALEVVTLGGVRYAGDFAGMAGALLRLSTRDGVVEVPMPVVQEVLVQGTTYSPEAFAEGLRLWGQALLDEVARVPPPVVVGGLSVLWAGAGPAALGDWKAAFAYTLLEGSFVGAGAAMVYNEQYGPLLPLVALDVLLHVWAVSDSVGESKRRRARAALAFTPLPSLDPSADPGLAFGLSVTLGARDSRVSAPAMLGVESCVEMGLTGDCAFP